MAAEPTSPLATVSTVDALADALREQILDGSIPAGSHLRELELTDVYRVGRHSVRSALQALSHEGLVRHEANRGAFVATLDDDDVRDLFQVRTAIEVECIAAVTASGEVPQVLADALAKFEQLTREDSWSDVVEADLNFHFALVDALDSPRMSRFYRALATEIRLCVAHLRPVYEDPAELAREHHVLVDAIAAGDPERAAKLMREHLDAAVADLTGEAT